MATYDEKKKLRRGWTTGANAAAAALMALKGFHYGVKNITHRSVKIDLPHHSSVLFHAESLIEKNGHIIANFKKDAGDDPDITHGIIISAEIFPIKKNNNDDTPTIMLEGGDGVGRVTRLGLPIEVGAPAITKHPMNYIKKNFLHYLEKHPDLPQNFQIIFHLENGAELSKQTLNPRLGIVGGLSILGSSGVVIPYSCAAWIDSIHRSIDVAMANHQYHLIAATGSVSEATAKEKLHLGELAMIDMGDFYHATMKYLRKKNYSGLLTIAGGPGKLLKLAQGYGDLHNERSRANMGWLADKLTADLHFITDDEKTKMTTTIEKANSVAEVLAKLSDDNIKQTLCQIILHHCQKQQQQKFSHNKISFMMVDRSGNIIAQG
ncbi:MAG: cobalt-precorrin-5B (C(1))-methyltransferase CbiD [Alphaproteobacteria bacterium]